MRFEKEAIEEMIKLDRQIKGAICSWRKASSRLSSKEALPRPGGSERAALLEGETKSSLSLHHGELECELLLRCAL